MIKKIISFCILLLLPIVVLPVSSQSNTIDTSVVSNWKIDAKPLDMVHTLDPRKSARVFILGDDSKVHVFSLDGKEQGSIVVDKGVTSIDITPGGELLYLANTEKNTFTTLSVSFTTPIDITDAPFLGNENAPVVLALFSDFQ